MIGLLLFGEICMLFNRQSKHLRISSSKNFVNVSICSSIHLISFRFIRYLIKTWAIKFVIINWMMIKLNAWTSHFSLLLLQWISELFHKFFTFLSMPININVQMWSKHPFFCFSKLCPVTSVKYPTSINEHDKYRYKDVISLDVHTSKSSSLIEYHKQLLFISCTNGQFCVIKQQAGHLHKKCYVALRWCYSKHRLTHFSIRSYSQSNETFWRCEHNVMTNGRNKPQNSNLKKLQKFNEKNNQSPNDCNTVKSLWPKSKHINGIICAKVAIRL